jgi:hypothetical protein
MRRAIAWWLSAPVDMQAAVALIVLPWILLAAVLMALPPPHH